MAAEMTRHGSETKEHGVFPRLPAPPRWSALRTDGVILLVLAGFLLREWGMGRVPWYVASRYVWLTPMAAGVLALMAIAALCHRGDSGLHACGCPSEAGGGEHAEPSGSCCHTHAHGHERRRPVFRALLLVPFVLGVVVDPRRLSAEGVRKRQMPSPRTDLVEQVMVRALGLRRGGASTRGKSAGSTPGTSVLPPNPTVRDVVEAVRQGKRDALDGCVITLEGQCEPIPGADRGEFDLVRIVVVCCLADALAVFVRVAPPPDVSVESGEWVRVRGILRFDAPDAPDLPVIHATAVIHIPEPANPYL